MTWSSALTSRTARAGGLLCAALLLGGCAAAKRPAPPVPAYADLNVLVRGHPGWQSVAQFDGMLARLKAAARQAQAGAVVPATALALPAQAGLDLPGTAFTLPPAALEQQQRQLAQQEQAQLTRLRARRERARQQQLELQQPRWRREAQLQYVQAAQAAQARFAERNNAAFAANDVRRLNLMLQINVLKKTVADWNLSTPPTPLLNQAKKDLVDKTSELKGLDAERAGLTGTLQAERSAALAQAAAAREAYVETQQAQLAETLRVQDDAVLAAQQVQLGRQTALLLQQERALAAGTVPAAGSTAAIRLPATAARTGRPARNLQTATGSLQTQRDRWIAFLYDDTQAAARDAARQRGWTVTFDPSGRGEINVTAQLAVLLAKSVWKN